MGPETALNKYGHFFGINSFDFRRGRSHFAWMSIWLLVAIKIWAKYRPFFGGGFFIRLQAEVYNLPECISVVFMKPSVFAVNDTPFCFWLMNSHIC